MTSKVVPEEVMLSQADYWLNCSTAGYVYQPTSSDLVANRHQTIVGGLKILRQVHH